jgi:hypothetical protein
LEWFIQGGIAVDDDKWGLIIIFALVLSFFAFKSSNTSTSVASLPKSINIERDNAGRMAGVVYSRE